VGFYGILIATAAGWYLAGLSWTISLVTYPAFSLVGKRKWRRYHDAHARRIVPAVGPMWAAQGLGIALWLSAPPHGTRPALVLTACAAAATAVVTAFAAIPAHAALARDYDPVADRRLARAHALRTIAWTVAALGSAAALALARAT